MTRRRSAAEKARYEWLHEIGICAVSGRPGEIQVAHIRVPDSHFAKPIPGTGNKPHWVWTLPLCQLCHREQHHVGEQRFWDSYGFPTADPLRSPLTVALVLEGFRQSDNIEGARRWLRLRATGRL